MSTFKSKFGINEDQIQKTCVLAPLLSKDILSSFEIKELSKGHPYSSANSDNLTLIKTNVGAPFTGDAVLNLKDTPCENLILLGSCGLVKQTEKLKIGSLVIPRNALELESFSQLLTKKYDLLRFSEASTDLLDNLISCAQNNATIVSCATMGSIFLEPSLIETYYNFQISALDMECSAFFNAAQHVEKNAVALLFATDILEKNDPYTDHTNEEKEAVHSSLLSAINIIKALSEKLL